ncbi:Leucine-rich repeat protein 1 [Geodia barretti]|uniref:Leucine-rich repeat protein 1 n=1 Tax=Geodia barretti TaxID=519541 RepID=A0AA35TIW0_GEOBA|nr:Leucine-rich repeat protein 1 [Geodia barretti]
MKSKLSCELELTYALAVSSGSVPSRSSRSRAAITLGKKPGSAAGSGRREELYVIVSTAKNVTGSKYKVKGNVCRVFSKFVEEGKATIEFKEPAHRLAISKADPGQLRELLKVLKLSPAQQSSVSLTALPPTKMADIEKPKTRLVVKSRGEYPLRGFPSSLERFEAVAISLNRVDGRLLQLKHLSHLDLSGNLIKTLPRPHGRRPPRGTSTLRKQTGGVSGPPLSGSTWREPEGVRPVQKPVDVTSTQVPSNEKPRPLKVRLQ